MSGELLIVTADSVLARTAAAACAGRALRACADLAELAATLASARPPVVLVDAEPDPVAIARRLEPLIARHPGPRFVLLARDGGPQLLLEAMQAGVRHCVPRERLAAELPGVLARLLAGEP